LRFSRAISCYTFIGKGSQVFISKPAKLSPRSQSACRPNILPPPNLLEQIMLNFGPAVRIALAIWPY